MALSGLSVIVPVYNSEQSLPMLVERLQPVLDQLGHLYELILINDGSRDASWQVIASLVEQHNWIRGFNLMRNFGQHNALLCGIRAAAYETAITMDDDLQNPPEEIPVLLAKLADGYDVVYGAPRQMQHGFLRNVASRITKRALQNVMGVDAATKVSAFRAFRTQLRDAFGEFHGQSTSIDVLLTWGTTRFTAVDVQFDVRQFGTSNYTLRALIRHAITMITGFSVLPLQLASMLGFGFTLFGIAIFAYVVGRYFLEGSIPGFPFLASIISIFSGVQLFALGIMGEYLARMHLRLMDRPSYVIREIRESVYEKAEH